MPASSVFHGILGLKTHCKLALLVRHDPKTESPAATPTSAPATTTRSTARFYTDISLLTSARPEITAAVQAQRLQRYLTAAALSPTHYKPLLVSPLTLAEHLHSH